MYGKNQSIGRLLTLIVALLFAFSIFNGCGRSGTKKGTGAISREKTIETSSRLSVVATTNIVADVVKQIAGDKIDLYVLIPAGSDPHSYQPKPTDFSRMIDADIVFMNGAGLEEFMNKAFGKIINSSNVVSLSDDLKLRESPNEKGEKDPHVWFYPGNVKHWVEKISEKLSELDSVNSTYYEQRKDSYIRELEKLDSWVKNEVTKIPLERRLLITDHFFMGYFADAYGFKVAGAIYRSHTTVSEPSAKDISQLVETIKKRGIKAIFVGINSNTKVASLVARESGAKVVPIYTGTLDAPGGRVDSYVKLIKYDVEAIVDNLFQ